VAAVQTRGWPVMMRYVSERTRRRAHIFAEPSKNKFRSLVNFLPLRARCAFKQMGSCLRTSSVRWMARPLLSRSELVWRLAELVWDE